MLYFSVTNFVHFGFQLGTLEHHWGQFKTNYGKSPVFLEIHACSQLSVALFCAFTLSWPPSPGENPGSQASSQCTFTFSSTIHQSTSIPFHSIPFHSIFLRFLISSTRCSVNSMSKSSTFHVTPPAKPYSMLPPLNPACPYPNHAADYSTSLVS